MFLYLIHLLYLFYVKLFSQSETIFTNEHKILSWLSLIFALFDLFKRCAKYLTNGKGLFLAFMDLEKVYDTID